MTGPHVDIRVRCDAPQWERFKEWLLGYGALIATCFEMPNNENPHYHAYFRLAGSTIDALKRARSRYFKDQEDMKGNQVASLSEMDKPVEFLEYLCKGKYAYKNQQKLYCGRSEWVVEVFDTDVFTGTPKFYHEAFWKRHANDKPRASRNFTKDVILEFEEKFISESTVADELDPGNEILMPNQVDPYMLYEFVEQKFCGEFKPFKLQMVSDIMRTIWLRNRTHFTGTPYSHDGTYDRFKERLMLSVFNPVVKF